MDTNEALLARIARGEKLAVQKVLDWEARSLRLNGIELGGFIRNPTLWAYLTMLGELKPHKPGLENAREGVVPSNWRIADRSKAANCRRELGRALPPGVLRQFIKAVPGNGHKLCDDVRVAGRSEAGLVHGHSYDDAQDDDEADAL